jgi:hypothetical protein
VTEPARLRAEWRRARYGDVRALHWLVLCAAGRTPSAIAAVLFGSRSRVSRVVQAARAGRLPGADPSAEQARRVRLRLLPPRWQRSLWASLQTVPRAYGGGRTRGSGAPLALAGPARRGGPVSAATGRRGLPELGGVWQRAQLAAKVDEPPRGEKVARIGVVVEPLPAQAALFFAAERDSQLVPKVG